MRACDVSARQDGLRVMVLRYARDDVGMRADSCLCDGVRCGCSYDR